MGLDQVELIMAVEEEFNIELADDALATVHTVGDFYEAIKKMLGNVTTDEFLKHNIFNKVRRALMQT